MKCMKILTLVFSLCLGIGCGDDGGDGNGGDTPSGCGDQFAYSDTNDYSDLASVLNDDVLKLDISQPRSSCGYLGLESGASDVCGGRQLEDDVIDISYSVLANGETSGVVDGVPQNDKVFEGSFPFLATPHN